jgi:hypothetical protein
MQKLWVMVGFLALLLAGLGVAVLFLWPRSADSSPGPPAAVVAQVLETPVAIELDEVNEVPSTSAVERSPEPAGGPGNEESESPEDLLLRRLRWAIKVLETSAIETSSLVAARTDERWGKAPANWKRSFQLRGAGDQTLAKVDWESQLEPALPTLPLAGASDWIRFSGRRGLSGDMLFGLHLEEGRLTGPDEDQDGGFCLVSTFGDPTIPLRVLPDEPVLQLQVRTGSLSVRSEHSVKTIVLSGSRLREVADLCRALQEALVRRYSRIVAPLSSL